MPKFVLLCAALGLFITVNILFVRGLKLGPHDVNMTDKMDEAPFNNHVLRAHKVLRVHESWVSRPLECCLLLTKQ